MMTVFWWCFCFSGEGRKRSQLSIPATSIYTLGGHDIDLANMVGLIKPPSGAAEPCMLTKKPDGKLGTSLYYAYQTKSHTSQSPLP